MTKTIQALAGELYDALEIAKRPYGEFYTKLSDDSPGWMTDVVRENHNDGSMLPDDWRFAAIKEAASDISSGDGEADELRESIDDWTDPNVDCYNDALLKWVSSNMERPEYVNDAVDEYGWPGDFFKALQYGQLAEYKEVYHKLIDSLEELANEEEDEESS